MKARFGIAGALMVVVAMTAPSAASAATLSVSPNKSCYRGDGVLDPVKRVISGEPIILSGAGFTPNGAVSIVVDGKLIGTDDVDAAGNFDGELRPNRRRGEVRKTITVSDQSNPANTGTVRIRVTGVTVRLSPEEGAPDRRFRIGARGFTTGKRLYAHIVKGHRVRRTIRIGRLKGPCHKLVARKRLFPSNAAFGSYRVQFDARRRYSKRTKVKVIRPFDVTPGRAP